MLLSEKKHGKCGVDSGGVSVSREKTESRYIGKSGNWKPQYRFSPSCPKSLTSMVMGLNNFVGVLLRYNVYVVIS